VSRPGPGLHHRPARALLTAAPTPCAPGPSLRAHRCSPFRRGGSCQAGAGGGGPAGEGGGDEGEGGLQQAPPFLSRGPDLEAHPFVPNPITPLQEPRTPDQGRGTGISTEVRGKSKASRRIAQEQLSGTVGGPSVEVSGGPQPSTAPAAGRWQPAAQVRGNLFLSVSRCEPHCLDTPCESQA
jgi:hypothetical protein